MSKLISIELNDIRHKENKLWIDENSSLYYGKDENNLRNPEYYETIGKLPLITIKDIEHIIKAIKTGEDFKWRE